MQEKNEKGPEPFIPQPAPESRKQPGWLWVMVFAAWTLIAILATVVWTVVSPQQIAAPTGDLHGQAETEAQDD